MEGEKSHSTAELSLLGLPGEKRRKRGRKNYKMAKNDFPKISYYSGHSGSSFNVKKKNVYRFEPIDK